jgi:glutaminyl-tRNA synthetase
MFIISILLFSTFGYAFRIGYLDNVLRVKLARSKVRLLMAATGMPPSEDYDKNIITKNFITNIIDEDLRNMKNDGRVLTRFPPEPNGYLHLGHAKSIHLNFGVAKAYNGLTNMRFDDTNPEKEDREYANAILDDVRWLITGDTDTGTLSDNHTKDKTKGPWNGSVRYTSDYFDILYKGAEYLIEQGKAYVDSLSADEMKIYRGTLTKPGMNSPYRDRSITDNLQLFRDMKNGKYIDGQYVLRAKIDMKSSNINMRDPTLYRIRHVKHPMTGK